jgi:hypothetical protein
MRVESTCIRQIKKKTGATIFLNRMALPLVVPQCEVGGAAPDEICVLLLQFLSSWVLAHTCTAIDANGQAMRMVRRCEWSGDANGQAMRMVMRCEWSCEGGLLRSCTFSLQSGPVSRGPSHRGRDSLPVAVSAHMRNGQGDYQVIQLSPCSSLPWMAPGNRDPSSPATSGENLPSPPIAHTEIN